MAYMFAAIARYVLRRRLIFSVVIFKQLILEYLW